MPYNKLLNNRASSGRTGEYWPSVIFVLSRPRAYIPQYGPRAGLVRGYYYMANPVLGKSLCSDWFFLGQDSAVRTVSMETVQSVYFCFGAKPANSTFATKTEKKNLH